MQPALEVNERVDRPETTATLGFGVHSLPSSFTVRSTSPRVNKKMNLDPFSVAGSTARDREEVLFDFLAQQARAPDPGVWSHCAAAPGKEDDVGFCALLLANLIERAAPGSSSTLYGIATTLLGARLTPAHFAAWLRTTAVDVRRLAAHLDHALCQGPDHVQGVRAG